MPNEHNQYSRPRRNPEGHPAGVRPKAALIKFADLPFVPKTSKSHRWSAHRIRMYLKREIVANYELDPSWANSLLVERFVDALVRYVALRFRSFEGDDVTREMPLAWTEIEKSMKSMGILPVAKAGLKEVAVKPKEGSIVQFLRKD